MESNTQIRVELVNSVVIMIFPNGRYDQPVSLLQRTKELVSNGHLKFVFDLSLTEGTTSTGLGELVAAIAHVKGKGGAMVAIAPSGSAMADLFRLTKLQELVPVYGSRNEALAALESMAAP